MVALIILFILTGILLGPELLATIPASVYMVAVLMPLAGYVAGYGLGALFKLPPNCKRTVSLQTGCQNVQLCTAILKLAFPPQVIGGIYMFPLLYALFQVAEAALFVLAYKIYTRGELDTEPPGQGDDTDISYKKLKEEELTDSAYGAVNPNLTPRLRKANTKDVGVQVNPRTDASVQCSLGPRTLVMMTMRRRGAVKRRPLVQGSQASMPKNVRFRRTMAIYSPIVSPNLNTFLSRGEARDAGQADRKEPAEKPQQAEQVAAGEEQVAAERTPEQVEECEEQGTAIADGPTDPPEQPEDPATDENEQDSGNVIKTTPREKRLRFQFLEQKYGYFHCKDCNARWESAYVWCVQGTNKVYFKQFCRTCEKAYNPYRVEDITCQKATAVNGISNMKAGGFQSFEYVECCVVSL
ncbi:hypothetical protein scyTo_0000783 [Scyliorhinus torazame]|uniref:3CxxC-type domain-containing protein n=1 Tax=Scyliorhinus torazame TaxID=75743 RepID=A0A401P410_SCYTO|nr:hypothetical protein [Scyliorhinus torazame]